MAFVEPCINQRVNRGNQCALNTARGPTEVIISAMIPVVEKLKRGTVLNDQQEVRIE